jgi:hypothetical protein
MTLKHDCSKGNICQTYCICEIHTSIVIQFNELIYLFIYMLRSTAIVQIVSMNTCNNSNKTTQDKTNKQKIRRKIDQLMLFIIKFDFLKMCLYI